MLQWVQIWLISTTMATPDIFVTEMLPEDDASIKTKTTFENWDKYQLDLKYDYYHQFTRNMLQLNNGNNTFSEIGRLVRCMCNRLELGSVDDRPGQ